MRLSARSARTSTPRCVTRIRPSSLTLTNPRISNRPQAAAPQGPGFPSAMSTNIAHSSALSGCPSIPAPAFNILKSKQQQYSRHTAHHRREHQAFPPRGIWPAVIRLLLVTRHPQYPSKTATARRNMYGRKPAFNTKPAFKLTQIVLTQCGGSFRQQAQELVANGIP